MKKITKKLPLIKNIYSVVDNFVNATNNLQEQINYLNEQIIDLRQLYSKKVNDGLFIKDRIAVYTAIIGEYDSLHEIECIDEECDYFCFTDDSKLQSKTWQVININKYPELSGGGCLTKRARYLKTHPHVFLNNYKYNLWCDGNLTISRSLIEMIKLYLLDNEILTFTHPHRTSIFEEADECKRLHKDKIEIINKQIEKYKKDGYTDKSHLVMTNMLFRYNTDSVNRFNEMWWEQINNYSKRDQISFNYVLWKLNMMCDTCDLNAFNNPYFKYSQHNRKQRV